MFTAWAGSTRKLQGTTSFRYSPYAENLNDVQAAFLCSSNALDMRDLSTRLLNALPPSSL